MLIVTIVNKEYIYIKHSFKFSLKTNYANIRTIEYRSISHIKFPAIDMSLYAGKKTPFSFLQ
jgi:hypothetical protein